MRIAMPGLALLLCTSVAASSAAGDDHDTKKALAYLKAGTARQEAGNCKQAIPAFKRGAEHKPLPELLRRLGDCQRTLGDQAAAATAYRAYLQAAPDAPERGDIERYLAGGERSATPAPRREAKSQAARAPVEGEPDPFAESEASAARPRATAASQSRQQKVKCRDGQVAAPASAGHCCWPEQVWTPNGCIGTPECPDGFERRGRTCAPLEYDEPDDRDSAADPDDDRR